METKVLFFDFDGTLNDLDAQLAQYVQQIGQILMPLYGGTLEAWHDAGFQMIRAFLMDYGARFHGNPLAGYNAWLAQIRLQVTEVLFKAMHLPIPSDVAEIAERVQFQALAGCNAAYPGVVETLPLLAQRGYPLSMASANDSTYLQAALRGAEIEPFITNRFGPDLVNCAKEGPEFYVRIFAATGVVPANAIVIEDQPDALGWAQEVGAQVIQARLSPHAPEPVPGVEAVLTRFTDLPHLIEQMSLP